jgi:hypothetical protein
MADLGIRHYRFSFSWTRLLPGGFAGTAVNPEGVAHYNRWGRAVGVGLRGFRLLPAGLPGRRSTPKAWRTTTGAMRPAPRCQPGRCCRGRLDRNRMLPTDLCSPGWIA